jgi:hypothetical protein
LPFICPNRIFNILYWRYWEASIRSSIRSQDGRALLAATELDPAIVEIEKARHSEGGASDLMDRPSPDPGPGLISIASG